MSCMKLETGQQERAVAEEGCEAKRCKFPSFLRRGQQDQLCDVMHAV
jgi:hypothetical protein